MGVPSPASSASCGCGKTLGGQVLSFSQRNVPLAWKPCFLFRGAKMPSRWALASAWLGTVCLGLGALESLLTDPPTGISWDGFRGARVIAFPGSTAYARNHGVYLTDPQVVSPLRWQHHGQLSQPRVASRSCALGSLWSWTSCRGLDLEEFPLWQQLLCSLSLLSNSNGTWTLCQALFSLTCRAYPFLLSGVRRCSPGGMLVPVRHVS